MLVDVELEAEGVERLHWVFVEYVPSSWHWMYPPEELFGQKYMQICPGMMVSQQLSWSCTHSNVPEAHVPSHDPGQGHPSGAKLGAIDVGIMGLATVVLVSLLLAVVEVVLVLVWVGRVKSVE